MSPSPLCDDDDAYPIGPGNRKVEFPPSHNPKLPAIYIMPNHPLHCGGGNTYYFIHDRSPAAAKDIYHMEVNKLKIPQGPHSEAIELGRHICTFNNSPKRLIYVRQFNIDL